MYGLCLPVLHILDSNMVDIQKTGEQILSNNPMKFYIFVGDEYGIKEKYIKKLKNYYNKYIESDSVSEILQLMIKKHIIPLEPTLYIIRYDEDFINSLDKKTNEKIHKFENKIIGTVVCVYETTKHSEKCAKYLPDFTTSFNHVDSKFIKKYLKSDFPELKVSLIDFAEKYSSDYKSAYNLCLSLNNANSTIISKYKEKFLIYTLGANLTVSESDFRYGVATRNFKYCISVLDRYNDDKNALFYVFLQTMIDLEKMMADRRFKSDLKDYARLWNINDIYNMFMNVYSEIERSRNISAYDIDSGIIYLLSLLQFSPIPKVGSLCY